LFKILISPLLLLGIISLVPSPVTQSFASTSNNLTITGNDDTALMELKATKENGKSTKVSDFRLEADNVLYINQNDKVTVQDNADFTRALVTDSNDNEKRIGITDGSIDFAGYAQGVYTLDVVVDDRRAYEAIIVIGEQDEQEVNKEITRVNNKQIVNIEIWIEVDCGMGYHLDEYGFCIPDEPSVCYFEPNDPACDPIDGKCPDGFGFNDDDRCIPQGKCPDGYVRADDDETGTCFEKGKDDRIKECADGSVRLVGDTCYYTPEPGEGCAEGYELTDYGECREIKSIDKCVEGYQLIEGVCVPMDDTCMGGPPGIDGCPVQPTPTPTSTPPVDLLSTTPTPTPNLLARGLLPTTPSPTPIPDVNECNEETETMDSEGNCVPIENDIIETPESTSLPTDDLRSFSTEEIPDEPVEDEPDEEESEDEPDEEESEDEPDEEESEGNGESTEDNTTE
jgi:hypothetical protein